MRVKFALLWNGKYKNISGSTTYEYTIKKFYCIFNKNIQTKEV